MNQSRSIKVLGVEAPERMYFWNYEEGPAGDGEFRVHTLYSGFSPGTELTFFKATNPFFHSRYDGEYGIFHAGEPATHFPVPFLGYMEVGRVVESQTDQVAEGDVVAMTYGHKSGHTADARQEFFQVLPADLDPVLGIYIAQMGPVAANGLLHAAAEEMGAAVHDLGDGVRGRNVLITGAGVVGLLTGLFAQHHGAANVAIADCTPQRLDVVRASGMQAVDETQIEAWRWCKERWHHGRTDRGADVVFQCRATEQALPIALRALRPDHCVIDLAFYPGAQPMLRLGEEFHHNGLAVRCAQVYHQPRQLRQSWDRRRLAEATLDLLRSKGALIRRHLLTDVVPFAEAPQIVADMAARKKQSIQTVFEFEL